MKSKRPYLANHLTTVRRIAVVRALYLGDLLLAVPALRALRQHYTEAEITLIGLPWAAAFAARLSAYVDRFLAFPGYPGIAEEAYSPERTSRFLAEQRAYGYDLVLQMHGNGSTSNAFALALGGRVTSGYYVGAAPDGLSPAARYPTDQSEVLRNLGLARLVGCPALDDTLEFPVLAADRVEASGLLQDIAANAPITPLVGMHVGAKAPSRRWPFARFAAVADELIEQHGAHVVLTGNAADSAITRLVRLHMRHTPLDLAGKTSLGGLAAVIERMSLFIGNDSGPAHLAEAVGTPSITLFGPTDPRRWAPRDQRWHRIVREPVACSPCAYAECPIDHRCLRRIMPAQVMAQASELLTATREANGMKGVRACGA